MSTQHAPLFAALAAPWPKQEVKSRTQAGRQMSYLTARQVMIRLDEIVGPENWWDDYTPLERSVVCRLSIRLPDGQVVTKSDAGGMAGMQDEGDDEKSGFSDAFKRAAVKFGVGRYLYNDGIAKLTPVSQPKAQASPVASAPGVETSPAAKPALKRPPAPPVVEDVPDGQVWDDGPIPTTAPTPMSAAELYDHVKRTGQLRALRAIQEKCGYPQAVREWSTEQVRTAFERLPNQIAAKGAA